MKSYVEKLMDKYGGDLPFPLPLEVCPRHETKHEKKMAKLMEKLINYQYAQAWGSEILKTPWGVLTWTPKNKKQAERSRK